MISSWINQIKCPKQSHSLLSFANVSKNFNRIKSVFVEHCYPMLFLDFFVKDALAYETQYFRNLSQPKQFKLQKQLKEKSMTPLQTDIYRKDDNFKNNFDW